MIDIEEMKPGNIVRHKESGRAYIVTDVHQISRRIFAIRHIEICNPDEWEIADIPKSGMLTNEESLTP